MGKVRWNTGVTWVSSFSASTWLVLGQVWLVIFHRASTCAYCKGIFDRFLANSVYRCSRRSAMWPPVPQIYTQSNISSAEYTSVIHGQSRILWAIHQTKTYFYLRCFTINKYTVHPRISGSWTLGKSRFVENRLFTLGYPIIRATVSKIISRALDDLSICKGVFQIRISRTYLITILYCSLYHSWQDICVTFHT